ncbi:NmrA family transcriptional regulator [Amycolatopsis sp. cg5]|uniref:NmrA family NAD(P)-binding protein n=1 Tax=Amycolatopsis sp. cg5 TaxID=3238802 RepID=UPI003526B3DE
MTNTLITGGTGKTGGRVAQRLGDDARVGSRQGSPAFDWEDRSTWEPALEGMDAAYLSYFPDLAVPGAAETVGAFAELAVAQGAKRLVLLSGRGEEGAEAGERAVQAYGADWTILRASWFDQNFSEGYLLEPVLDGTVALPAGDTPEPFVDADDIADVAVAAFSDAKHIGEVYELTGPRLLTFAEATAEIAKAAGRDIRFQQITFEEFASPEIPADVLALLNYLFTEVLDGRNARVADGVQRALGRAPRDFTDYAREAAARGAWEA